MTAEAAGKRNVFVVGLDDFNRELLERLPSAQEYHFVQLLPPERIVQAESFDLPALLNEARAQLNAAEGTVSAIVGYWDFPTQLMLPILRKEWGLPGPSLEAVLRCEHKYWSRLCQREIVPGQIPHFQLFDPFADNPAETIELALPVWVKPVKSHSSYLSFAIHHPEQLEYAVRELRENVSRFAEPFESILQHADLPPEVARVRAHECLVEETISTSWQSTLEGWVHGDWVDIFGVVDSIREGEHNSSFSRYQYPSRLPGSVQRRMADMSERLVRYLGLDETGFNVEFFYDVVTDQLWLLEINARPSKSHGLLFEMVDGVSNLEVMLATGLGHKPRLRRGKGRDDVAAKFMVRVYEDGVVTRAPTAAEMAHLAEEFADVALQVHVREGMRLSELSNQDSYSYELASVFIGARDEGELLDKYLRCLQRLPFDVRTETGVRSRDSVVQAPL